jgi:DNA-binding XRE family transcriptional regulator
MKAAKTLDEVLALETPEAQARIEARHQSLVAEARGLKSLREIAQRSQAEMAGSMGIKQPTVHRIEGQADVMLSTLRRYVEAAGGSLEINVKLPGHPRIRLTGLADLHD